MKIDYHMHFEYGSYDLEWVQGFFESAKKNGVGEIGISEHSHGFIEFEDLYYEDATESIESGEIMKDPKIKKKSTKQSRLKSLEESLEEQGITPTEVRKIVSKESNR